MSCPRCQLDRQAVRRISTTSKPDRSKVPGYSLWIFGDNKPHLVDDDWFMMVCQQCADDLTGKSQLTEEDVRAFIMKVAQRSKSVA